MFLQAEAVSKIRSPHSFEVFYEGVGYTFPFRFVLARSVNGYVSFVKPYVGLTEFGEAMIKLMETWSEHDGLKTRYLYNLQISGEDFEIDSSGFHEYKLSPIPEENWIYKNLPQFYSFSRATKE